MALDHQDRQAIGQFMLDDAIGKARRRRKGKVKVEAQEEPYTRSQDASSPTDTINTQS
jgi:hypothetical protein